MINPTARHFYSAFSKYRLLLSSSWFTLRSMHCISWCKHFQVLSIMNSFPFSKFINSNIILQPLYMATCVSWAPVKTKVRYFVAAKSYCPLDKVKQYSTVVCARSSTLLQKPACHMGSRRVICHPAEAASSALTLAGTQFIHQLRLNRSEPTQVNDLSRSAGYTSRQLIKLAFCPTRHSRCEQLAHSFTGI